MFSDAFMRDLSASWSQDGATVLKRVAKENPSSYFSVCARLLPAEVTATIEQTVPCGLDADDLAILRAIKQSLPDANSRTPSEVLNYVLDAVRAHSSHQLIDASQDAQT